MVREKARNQMVSGFSTFIIVVIFSNLASFSILFNCLLSVIFLLWMYFLWLLSNSFANENIIIKRMIENGSTKMITADWSVLSAASSPINNTEMALVPSKNAQNTLCFLGTLECPLLVRLLTTSDPLSLPDKYCCREMENIWNNSTKFNL